MNSNVWGRSGLAMSLSALACAGLAACAAYTEGSGRVFEGRKYAETPAADVAQGQQVNQGEPAVPTRIPGPGAGRPQQQQQQTDRLIVRYRGGDEPMSAAAAIQRAQALSRFTGQNLRHVSVTHVNGQVLSLDRKQSVGEVEALAEEIESREDVRYAEPDLIVRPWAPPPMRPRHDGRTLRPRGNTLLHHANGRVETESRTTVTGGNGDRTPAVGADRLWHYYDGNVGINLAAIPGNIDGTGVVVGVIDTGYRPHPDIVDNILPGHDFVHTAFEGNDGDGRDPDPQDPGDHCADFRSSWHGTHVAGTVAGRIDAEQGFRGVAPKAKILPLRALGKCGGYTSDVIAAMHWAFGEEFSRGADAPEEINPHPVKVLNLSLGSFGKCRELLQETIDVGRAAGVTIVVAAGNDEDFAHKFQPAGCEGVITVAATGRDGARAWYTNFGRAVDVAAPGGNITRSASDTHRVPENGVLSTENDGATGPGNDSFGYKQGTSMAAPHVAGVVALLYQVNPELTPDEVMDILKRSARPFPDAAVACTAQDCGAGIVDAAAAVQLATEETE